MKTLDQNIGVLHALMRPGQRLSTKAISEICGCSNSLIYFIERDALKKVRERLRRKLELNHAQMATQKLSDVL